MSKNDFGKLNPFPANGAKRLSWRWLSVFVLMIGGWIPTLAIAGVLEDFENGWGEWSTDGGVWAICEVQGWPNASLDGTSICAQTVCNGNYPADTDSRLISPICVVPSAAVGGHVELRFSQAFNYNWGDRGDVQVRARVDGEWGPWMTLPGTAAFGTGCLHRWSDWSPASFDLTAFVGQTIQLGFFHQAADVGGPNNCGADVAPGWYIDSVEIVAVDPPYRYSPGFEHGWGDWTADGGVWEIGPVASAPSGTHAAAAVLTGEYPADTSSRLISPECVVRTPWPAGGPVELRFMQRFAYNWGDGASVQIQVRDGAGWGPWVTLATPSPVNPGCLILSSGWAPVSIDIPSAYHGQLARFGFYHQATDVGGGNNCGADTSTGWVLDDVPINCPGDFNGRGGKGVQDVFDFLAAYFVCDPKADCSRDGRCGVEDIFCFLAYYFADC